jgi:hypothetical protein
MEEQPIRHAIVYVDKTGDIGQVVNFLHAIADSYETAHRLYELPSQLPPEEMHHLTSNDLEKVGFLPSENLHVASINCASPGFWEFVGNLNPLKFITDLIEAIIKWKESHNAWQLDMLRFNYESVAAYMDLLDRYDRMINDYGASPPRHRRFIKEQVEKMIQQIEQSVMPFTSRKKAPKLLGASEKPKEYVSIDDIKEKGSQKLSNTILSVLDPRNEKFRDLNMLSFIAINTDKLTRQQIIDQINWLIDQEFVIFDKKKNRIEPTKSGLSFYESLTKSSRDSK